ncbi:FecR family protein [Paraglaciecola sp. 2405UD69-4]|uniref:FecR family protein n=1 Tax=Paraglaciecola sp. 2405UD69-4 TaxID=3391836 RepID=UPI0039C8DCC8
MKVKTNQALFEIATDYYYRLQEPDITTEEIQQWQEWLVKAPEHAQAFKKVESLMCITASIDEMHWPDERELMDDDYDGSVSVAKWNSKQNSLFSKIKNKARAMNIRALDFAPAYLRFSVTAAVAFILVTTIFYFNLNTQSEFVYQSSKGENLPIILEDNSSVTLGADTKITVRYNKNARHIELEYGEAYFDVAKDPSRPFTVDSGSRSVTALGTEFNISRQSVRSVVTVTEGKVIVEPENDRYVARMTSSVFYKKLKTDAFLEAGQSIEYDKNEISAVETVDVQAQTSWRNGTLKYLDESLGFVIEDINRYSSIPIVIDDPRILKFRYSGTIFVEGIESWVQSLPYIFPVQIIDNNDAFKVDLQAQSEIGVPQVLTSLLDGFSPQSC